MQQKKTAVRAKPPTPSTKKSPPVIDLSGDSTSGGETSSTTSSDEDIEVHDVPEPGPAAVHADGKPEPPAAHKPVHADGKPEPHEHVDMELGGMEKGHGEDYQGGMFSVYCVKGEFIQPLINPERDISLEEHLTKLGVVVPEGFYGARKMPAEAITEEA